MNTVVLVLFFTSSSSYIGPTEFHSNVCKQDGLNSKIPIIAYIIRQRGLKYLKRKIHLGYIKYIYKETERNKHIVGLSRALLLKHKYHPPPPIFDFNFFLNTAGL